jgi:hypothetical protein
MTPRVAELLTSAIDRDPSHRPRDAQTFAHALIAANAETGRVRRTGWSAPLVWTTALVVFALATVIAWLKI